MIYPERLKKGDTIGVVAPSSPAPAALIPEIEKFINDLGYNAFFGKSVFSSSKGYSAGSPLLRARDINEVYRRSDIKAVWCLRGGHSGGQLPGLLDWDTIRQNPKIFIGFSDITVFLSALNRIASVVTFHGPMLCYDHDMRDTYSVNGIISAVNMENELVYTPPSLQPPYGICPGYASGRITGGCLSIICSLIGTPYGIVPDGKIIFLEDVDEPVCRLERMLYQLKYAGVFDRAAGVILGTFSGCENDFLPEWGTKQLFDEFFRDYRKPVLANFRAGHCTPKFTIPMGAVCRMDADRRFVSFCKE